MELKCNNCEEEVVSCDHCDEDFEEDSDAWCSELADVHFCDEKCALYAYQINECWIDKAKKKRAVKQD